jgi:anthranilate phosphoribosyltransferase
LMAAGKTRSPVEGVALAAESIGSGAALDKLRQFVEFSKAASIEN